MSEDICNEEYKYIHICIPDPDPDQITLESNYILLNMNIAIPYSHIQKIRKSGNLIFLQIAGEEQSIYLKKIDLTIFYFNQILERI